MRSEARKSIALILTFGAFFLIIRYFLPLFLPFVLGAALALAAEPMIRFFCGKLRMPRPLASGIGVSMAFSFLALVVLILCGLVIRELRTLAGILPDLESSIRTGMDALSGWLLEQVKKTPAGIQSILHRNVTGFFSGSSALLDRAVNYLLQLASGLLSAVPDGALGIGTAIISSFMISTKLPRIKAYVKARISIKRLQPVLDAVSRLKTALGGWLTAQLKLSGVNFCTLTLGLLLLRIPYAPLWAALIALVDAFPLLGTGVALIPWSLISFLQGDHILAFGLLGLYAAAAITRSVLEPRLVGKQLGLDPLVTLMTLYVGYKLFGFVGMLLSPMLAVAAVQILPRRSDSGSGNV